jgi:hypothetical protein
MAVVIQVGVKNNYSQELRLVVLNCRVLLQCMKEILRRCHEPKTTHC